MSLAQKTISFKALYVLCYTPIQRPAQSAARLLVRRLLPPDWCCSAARASASALAANKVVAAAGSAVGPPLRTLCPPICHCMDCSQLRSAPTPQPWVTNHLAACNSPPVATPAAEAGSAAEASSAHAVSAAAGYFRAWLSCWLHVCVVTLVPDAQGRRLLLLKCTAVFEAGTFGCC